MGVLHDVRAREGNEELQASNEEWMVGGEELAPCQRKTKRRRERLEISTAQPLLRVAPRSFRFQARQLPRSFV
jgi:hypothetical protein